MNPHLFWFKHKEQNSSFQAKIKNLEARLANNIPVESDCERIKINDVITLNWISQKKWIRVFVLGREDGKLIVWAIDYGIPIITTFDLIAKLDSCLEQECRKIESSVLMGGIYGVFPSTAGFNVCVYCANEYMLQQCNE